MKKHIGSTLALLMGAILFVSGLTSQSANLFTGIIIILGSLAYKSAKKRKYSEVNDTVLRKSLEALSLIVAMALILFQNNLLHAIQTNPVQNLIIPIWVLVAYAIVLFFKKGNNEQA